MEIGPDGLWNDPFYRASPNDPRLNLPQTAIPVPTPADSGSNPGDDGSGFGRSLDAPRLDFPLFPKREEKQSNLVTETVKTAPFLVSVSVQGTLDSQKNGTINNQVEGTTTIISIVPEGTKVTKGQIVAELDSSAIDEKLRSQSILLTTAESALTKAMEDLNIQKNQNESDIEAAKLAFELAQLDLDKYVNGEFKQLQSAAAGKVAIAQEAAVQAEEGFTYTSDRWRRGRTSRTFWRPPASSATRRSLIWKARGWS